MTLVEFLAPLAKGTHQDRVLAVLYFRERYEKLTALTVDDIRQGLKSARVKGWNKANVADVLNKCGALVDTAGVDGRKRLWSLTDSGREHIRDLLGLPDTDVEIEHDVGTLESLVKTLSEEDVRDYLAEALKCLQVGSLRACVVFVWSGAIRELQKKIHSHEAAGVNAAIQKHDPKGRTVKSLDDFAHIKDSLSLLAAKELGIIDKNEKDALVECLNLRNRSGHPGKYKPGAKKVSAYVEDITSILFT
jgi:DNA-binding MarR family transcriptional regulator